MQNSVKVMCRSDLLQKSFHYMNIKESWQLIPTGLFLSKTQLMPQILSLSLSVYKGAGFSSADPFSLFSALALQSEQLPLYPPDSGPPLSWGPFDLRRAKSRAQRKRTSDLERFHNNQSLWRKEELWAEKRFLLQTLLVCDKMYIYTHNPSILLLNTLH